ncbi:hypothetical protein EH31_09590 [Erythrobacter longus]|uniref:Phytase-like domain-containing protein n=1 Tax=Erythrobacter longus TaxID=1044 RepID=A0A074MXI9_ERYLO|nr:hypothetical protein EH31_09590 [Erythrobacter longus]
MAGLLAGGYIYLHDPFARDGTELLQVPLSEVDPSLTQVGDLKYLGGLDIPRMGQNIGGLSGLRWDAESGRLLAITDDARWVWITPEEAEGRLTGITDIKSGPLLGEGGEPLSGKAKGDSESLTSVIDQGWAVGFERDHRILVYKKLDQEPQRLNVDVVDLLGPLEENMGLEALAISVSTQISCAERQTLPGRPNCMASFDGGELQPLYANPPETVRKLGAIPTDADTLSDGTALILFRSYDPANGNSGAIVSFGPDNARRELLVLAPPLTVDNFEGLAVREEGVGEDRRTFLYIVSDDNFSGSQRTLLMKFELLAKPAN